MAPLILLYDGSCRLCQRGSARLVRMAAPGAIERVSFREPGVLERFPPVTAAAAEQAMQLILPDGRAVAGAEAAFRALATRAVFRPLLWLYLLPGLRQLFDAGYRLVARNRHRLGGGPAAACEDGACRVD